VLDENTITQQYSKTIFDFKCPSTFLGCFFFGFVTHFVGVVADDVV